MVAEKKNIVNKETFLKKRAIVSFRGTFSEGEWLPLKKTYSLKGTSAYKSTARFQLAMIAKQNPDVLDVCMSGIRGGPPNKRASEIIFAGTISAFISGAKTRYLRVLVSRSRVTDGQEHQHCVRCAAVRRCWRL